MSRLAIATLILVAAAYVGAQQVDSTGSPVTFANVTQSAGLFFTNINGASRDKYLVETMGSGALFFDFDDDG